MGKAIASNAHRQRAATRATRSELPVRLRPFIEIARRAAELVPAAGSG